MQYKIIELDVGTTIDSMVDLLVAYRSRGEYICTEFNGHIFYSDSVDLDEAYKTITGMTKCDFEAFVSSEKRRVSSANVKK